ncbi:MAG: putative dehydrogenase [Mariniblastus sp.]
MIEMLRYGFVGAGFIAKFHLEALRQVRGIEVAGFVSRTEPTELVAFARQHGLGEARVFDSVMEMVPHVDVVVILTPNMTRLEIVEEIVDAVKAGNPLKAVVCEKPLGRTLAEARRMLALAKDADLPTVYFENQLHMKSLKAARTQLCRVMETMGPPVLVRSNEEHAGPHKPWFWDPRQQGGGVMSDMGCHCLAVGWYMLTPPRKPPSFLVPQSVQADLALLKWGQPRWRQQLLDQFGVDYSKTPAEDFATGIVTYKNPETNQISKSQFTVSWMYDKQGLRLLCDTLGAGYGLEFNTLKTSLELFVGDAASAGVADAESALEKSQATQGLLAVQPNEADLYGYTDEHVDVRDAILENRPPLLDWEYGLEIVRLNLAAYLSSERGAVVDLTDPATLAELETYVPLIQQGRGLEVLNVQ